MTQELIDLRNSILEQRYTDALAIVDELEGMGRQVILCKSRNIFGFHLYKNGVAELRYENQKFHFSNSYSLRLCASA